MVPTRAATAGTLHFFAGFSHSGKSTAAARLSDQLRAPVFSIDHWINVISGPMRENSPKTDVERYTELYPGCLALIEETVLDLLRKGATVVLDFGGNSRSMRTWVRGILTASGSAHVLHVLQTPVEVCRARYASNGSPDKMPADHFDKVLKRYEPPTADEGFTIELVRGH